MEKYKDKLTLGNKEYECEVIDGVRYIDGKTVDEFYNELPIEEVIKLVRVGFETLKAEKNGEAFSPKEEYLVVQKPPQFIISTYKFSYEVDNPSFKFLKYRIFNEPNSGTIQETFYTLNLENAKRFFAENLKNYYEKYGSSSLDTVQIRTGNVTRQIEEDVKLAMQSVIEKWQPLFDSIDIEPIFEEKKRQIRQFLDFETGLTEEVERMYQNENYKSK